MTIISADLAPKRFGLLRELVPKARFFAALTNPDTPEGRGQASDMLTAGLALGLNLRLLEASGERSIDAVFVSLSQDKPDALLIASDPIFDVHRDKLVVDRGDCHSRNLSVSRLCGGGWSHELRPRHR